VPTSKVADVSALRSAMVRSTVSVLKPVFAILRNWP
jgi:hypothetical protein